MKSKTGIIIAFSSAFVVAFLGSTGAMSSDIREQAIDHIEYCENVRSKTWPDYRGIYKKECSAKRLYEVEQLLN